jgi:hypothetical protein
VRIINIYTKVIPENCIEKSGLVFGKNNTSYNLINISSFHTNHIGGIMVSMLAASVVYLGFEPRSGQPKDYDIVISCFSAKHAALRRKSKDWLAGDQDNVSEWSDMSTLGLLFQWANTIKIQLSMLV